MKHYRAVALILALLWLAALAGTAAAADPFIADRHGEAGLTCESCHGSSPPEAGAEVSLDTCLGCHGPYDGLAKKTAALARNPHGGHTPDLDCNVCHHGHRADDNYCSSCHVD